MTRDDIGLALSHFIKPHSSKQWRILSDLGKTLKAPHGEMLLRQALRPGAEAEAPSGIRQNIKSDYCDLDNALVALTIIEIGYEIKALDYPEMMADVRDDFKPLLKSQALLQYANTYLYFGVRFLACRLDPPPWLNAGPLQKPLTRREIGINERSFALVNPPELEQPADRFRKLCEFLKLTENDQNNQGLILLDRSFEGDVAAPSDGPGERRFSDHFELWLKGLGPEGNGMSRDFRKCREGLIKWIVSRSEFYLSLSTPGDVGVDEKTSRPLGGWTVPCALAARLALLDIYWIARLLKADFSAEGVVTYRPNSWLHLLRFQAEVQRNTFVAKKLRNAEEILRSVFDFVCDLVQNSIEISNGRELGAYEPEHFKAPSQQTADWREVFDRELGEIAKQRTLRGYSHTPPYSSRPEPRSTRHSGWTHRVIDGGQPHNLIGLALSGGGIRSATFCLGVLQGLQELDLLRQVDYLSTVSGGGFIGSWLVANVSRSSQWLGRLTPWDDSIAHLRRYSNYLAPLKGMLGADSWSLVGSWLRNTFLLQLNGLAWIFVVLALFLMGQDLFARIGASRWALPAASLLLLVFAGTCLYNLCPLKRFGYKLSTNSYMEVFAIIPALLGAFGAGSVLWAQSSGMAASGDFSQWYGFSHIFEHAWKFWIPLLAAFTFSMLAMVAATIQKKLSRLNALWISGVCALTVYLELCGIVWLLLKWSREYHARAIWRAYIFAPVLVLASITVGLSLLIGFCGRFTAEPQREWWTRLGATLSLRGLALFALKSAAVYGPLCTLILFNNSSHVPLKWGTVATWLGTVMGGLFAGKSIKTRGTDIRPKSMPLELLAKAGAILFIVGGLFVAATLLVLLIATLSGVDVPYTGAYWRALNGLSLRAETWVLAGSFLFAALFFFTFDINIFGLSQIYRNRLVRCYLGAARWTPGTRKPQPFTRFDENDDFPLSDLKDEIEQDASARPRDKYRGPFPVVNCSLNLGGSADTAMHTRHSASFVLTPLYCGSDRLRVGYIPIEQLGQNTTLGQAVAISGAAASPNMGYNTSPLIAFLLTMFNVRLGWWFLRPARTSRMHKNSVSALSLLRELRGSADDSGKFINLSDGGHFENLGVYELVRRRCKVIIACDAECDESLHFGALGNLVRICETDFGAKIDLDVSSVRKGHNSLSQAHCAVGRIAYSNGSLGHLILLKASITGDENVAVAQYRSLHPTFPHESTANQFFSEDQFESYRRLGQHILRTSFRIAKPGDHLVELSERLADTVVPSGCASEIFLKHSRAMDRIWERARESPALHRLMNELMGTENAGETVLPPPPNEHTLFVLQLIQFMESVFLDLRLDDFWEHPDNRGWAILFMRWARHPRFRAVWEEARRAFGIRFEYFCEFRLGLPRDRPVTRV